MTSNLNSSAFINETQNDYASKIIAETYMQIYQYAAEDFTTHPDMKRFITDLTSWMKSVDQRLAQQMQLISTHQHQIPPHVHGVINHSVTTPTPLITLVPTNSSSIRWSPITYPIYINTTLTEPNLIGNRIVANVASEGSALPTIRRLKPISKTLIPKLSPTLKDSLTAGL